MFTVTIHIAAKPLGDIICKSIIITLCTFYFISLLCHLICATSHINQIFRDASDSSFLLVFSSCLFLLCQFPNVSCLTLFLVGLSTVIVRYGSREDYGHTFIAPDARSNTAVQFQNTVTPHPGKLRKKKR